MKKTIQRICWTICICALAGWAVRGLAQETPVTNLVTLTTFDYDFDAGIAHNLRWSYPYHYEWGGDITPYWHSEVFYTSYYDPNDWGFTNAMGQFTFDNTGYGDFMTNYASAGPGYGVGFGGGLNWTNDSSVFTATNREDYILSFRARAEGLKAGVDSASGEFQLQLAAPDDTIQPPDANTDDDMLMQVNINFNVSSNWQDYVFTLDQGNIADGKTEEDFILYRFQGCNPRFNINYHQPEGNWDYDADNAVYIDNIRLEVVQKAPPPPPPPKVPLTIVEWNMDDKGLSYGWASGTNGGWSANGVSATFLLEQPSVGTGVGGTDSLLFWMMNEIYATNAPLPNWSGGQGGIGGPANFANFSSPNLADYRLSMDARVEGLNPASTTADFDTQIFINAPDPLGRLIQCNSNFRGIGSNWTHVSMILNKAGVGGGSAADFAANYSQVSEITLQIQLNNVANSNLWAFDTDNRLFLDNIKLEYLATSCPLLTITPSGADVTLSWDVLNAVGYVKVQRADDVAGPYSDVPGATSSPFTLPRTNSSGYFRTQWVPTTP